MKFDVDELDRHIKDQLDVNWQQEQRRKADARRGVSLQPEQPASAPVTSPAPGPADEAGRNPPQAVRPPQRRYTAAKSKAGGGGSPPDPLGRCGGSGRAGCLRSGVQGTAG
eukprot:5180804-Alexandrium_andersonii.AAC.1